MSDQNTQITDEKVSAQEKMQDGNVYRSFNYIGTKETIAYLFNDWSNTFNINGYSQRFIWDVVKIDFNIAAIVGIFTGAWDIINVTFISLLVYPLLFPRLCGHLCSQAHLLLCVQRIYRNRKHIYRSCPQRIYEHHYPQPQ